MLFGINFYCYKIIICDITEFSASSNYFKIIYKWKSKKIKLKIWDGIISSLISDGNFVSLICDEKFPSLICDRKVSVSNLRRKHVRL